MEKPKILFIDDDVGLNRQLRWTFSELDSRGAGDRQEAIRVATEFRPAVILLDLGMPPDVNGASEGLKTLGELRRLVPEAKIIVLTGNEHRDNAVKCVRLGAYDFCQKPMDQAMIRLIVERAINLHTLEQEYHRTVSAQPRSKLSSIVTGAENMLKACEMIERVAPTDASILLLGESGTGKELFARALHDLSARKSKAFVPINCGAIPATLLESELFGHEKGAFTGADRTVVGKVELADGGTLFLDEIGDMPFTLQVKLLRFLQDRIVERVGSRKTTTVDVRVISATNQNIDEQIASAKFREDLYFRINEVAVKIPPLRERPGDPELLAHYLLSSFAKTLGKPVTGFTELALDHIRRYSWPGNVRELQNHIKRAVILSRGEFVDVLDLGLQDVHRPVKGRQPPVQGNNPSPAGDSSLLSLKQARGAAEKQAIEVALSRAGGNISKAARLLEISRPTLYTLLTQYELAGRDEEGGSEGPE